jgi:hypothetical protein
VRWMSSVEANGKFDLAGTEDCFTILIQAVVMICSEGDS